MLRPSLAVVVAVAGPLLAGLTAAGAEPTALEFLRVHVPAGRLQDLPLGDGRYVPMVRSEFEAAVAAFGRAGGAGGHGPRPLADRSRYELSIDEAGRLAGRATFEVDAAANLLVDIGLGAVRAERGSVRTAAGTGEAVVFGRADGSMAVRVVGSGTYGCTLSVAANRSAERLFTLPLAAALATVVVVRSPPGLEPQFGGVAAERMLVTRLEDGAVQVELGPASALEINFEAGAPAAPLVATWTDVAMRPGGVDVATTLVPRTAWTADARRVRMPPGLQVTAVERAADGRPVDWTTADDGSTIVGPGRDSVGGREAIVVRGVAAAGDRGRWQVPVLRPDAATWAGGGLRIEIDPAWAVAGVDAEHWLPVTPEAAGRWPLPARGRPTGAGAAEARAAALHFEQQAADGRLELRLRPRRALFDVARVTTVGLSPGQVLGRAACDVRVVSGEAFQVRGRVLPGWIIDGVELFDPADVDATADDLPRGGVKADWRMEATARLVVDLAVAATPRRSLGLRISGHRGGIPLGGSFRTTDMDMVRFDGESADAAVVDFKLGPEALVEIDGDPVGIVDVSPRLARLAEPGTLRGRILGGQRAAGREARVVQRRPPLDARVDVVLAARDERLAEAFTFTCRSEAAAVDSLVVHFSEPMGDALQWSLVAPADGSIVARRLDRLDTTRGEGARSLAAAESWLVDITPAVLGEVRMRAARDLPFTEPQPVPLAWVEGGAAAVGTVTLADTGRGRPTIRNRRLRELPPAAAAAGRPAAWAEFAFPAEPADGGGGPAAEIAPAANADARAWAWREALTCRLHASGRAECESAFEIENHGRDAVSLTVLPGRRAEAVLIDGRPAPVESLDGGVTARIPLPPEARSVQLVVRTVAATDPRSGWWAVNPVGCTVDVPVLDQQLEIQVPPGLEIGGTPAGARETERSHQGVVERLCGVTAGRHDVATAGRSPPDVVTPDPLAAGFRVRRFVPAAGRGGTVEFLVVRRSLVTAVCLAAGCLTWLVVRLLARRLPGSGVLLAAAAALLALWLDPPAAVVARSAWWAALAAGVGGLVARGVARRQVAGILLATVVAATTASGTVLAGDDAAPLKVFLIPGADGGMALVPEPLYGPLSRQSGPAAAAVRITGCRIVVDPEAWHEPWRLVLDVDADAGGVLLLDQGADGGRWQPAAADADPVAVLPGGRLVRAVMPAAGRRRLELRVVPAQERRGAVDMASIRLPVAPAARLDLVSAGGGATTVAGDAVQCDRGRPNGPWLPAAQSADVAGRFDVAAADRVRLVRPTDGRRRLAAAVAATSLNDITWELAACRLRSRCTILGEGIVRGAVVAATPGLEPVADTVPQGMTMTSLGGGRHLVAWSEPAPGPAGFEVEWRMPLADPVGTFAVPGAWLEDATADDRTVRLMASPDLVAWFDPTPGAAFDPRFDSGDPGGEVRRHATHRAETGGGPARLGVRRRPQRPRGSQTLAVGFADDGVTLRLQARIDATSTPLMRILLTVPSDCEIERVTLREDEFGTDDAGGRQSADVQWSFDGRQTLEIFAQRPRAGRYRLEVDGRLPAAPPRGRLPLMRARLDGDTPLAVSWGRRGGAAKTVEVAADGGPPTYELEEEARAAPPPVAAVAAPPPPAAGTGNGERVEQARMRVVIDDRGRLRGIARFDVVARRPAIRLRLPMRMRLFDLLVDGRETPARPVAAETWEVELQDAAWPRTVLVVFTADLGSPAMLRQALRLEPPVIEGLPCPETLWEIDPPVGAGLRIAAPARALSAATWDGAVAAARSRVSDAFTLALATDAGPDAARLREFAEDRAAGRGTAVEEAWRRAIEPADARPVWAAVGDAGGLMVRIVPDAPPQAPARAAASAALAAAAAAAWLVARRDADRWARGCRWAGAALPWLLGGCGVAWVATLAAPLPGWLMILTGATLLAIGRRSRPAAAAAQVAPADAASTRSLPAG